MNKKKDSLELVIEMKIKGESFFYSKYTNFQLFKTHHKQEEILIFKVMGIFFMIFNLLSLQYYLNIKEFYIYF
jgi:hypothetical protein